LDYKTRGTPPRPGATERYYGCQADAYDLMLNSNGMPTGGRAFFAYYHPIEARDGALLQFEVSVVEIATSSRRAADLAVQATDCLAGPMPEAERDCEWCTWLAKRVALEGSLTEAPAVVQPVQLSLVELRTVELDLAQSD